MGDGGDKLALAIIGAGPCGIAVGAAAAQHGIPCTLFDKGCITSSLIDYPYYMTFFSTAENLEVAEVPFTTPGWKPTRREALTYYRKVVEHFSIDVRQYEEVTEVKGEKGNFRLITTTPSGKERQTPAENVVVATGGFHHPNFLDVPGEGLPKVSHYYKEPYPYFGQRALVIGGGNSAVETALDLFWNGAEVTMAHFADRFDRGVKPWVLPDIQSRIEKGEIQMHWHHRVTQIHADQVILKNVQNGQATKVANDWVLAMTGWRGNHDLLLELGVQMDEDTGIPHHEPETMETNVPGVFIAGVIAAGNDANKIFIENGKLHGDLIVRAVAMV